MECKTELIEKSTWLGKHVKNGSFKIIKEIGRGGYGQVYLAQDLRMKGNKNVAIKIIFQVDLTSENTSRALKEAEMLKNINCDYIIRYIDSFKETHYSVIITEYCENGDLKKLINEYKSLNKLIPDELLTDYFNQLINGLCYLHQNNIMHRDVKPENIFVLEKNQLKYGDLGISRMATSSRKLTQLVGSTNYMSPEVVNEKDYDCKCDVWSLGCVIYEMITLKKLFEGDSAFKVFYQINHTSIEPLKVETSNKFQYILHRALNKNLAERADTNELKTIMHSSQSFSIKENIPILEDIPKVIFRSKVTSTSIQSNPGAYSGLSFETSSEKSSSSSYVEPYHLRKNSENEFTPLEDPHLLELKQALKSFLSQKKFNRIRIRKYGSIFSSMDEFEKELRLKRNDQKYSVKAKLEKHLHKQGLNKKIVSELMKFTSEQYWPKPIRNEKLRIQNKRIIETYKCGDSLDRTWSVAKGISGVNTSFHAIPIFKALNEDLPSENVNDLGFILFVTDCDYE